MLVASGGGRGHAFHVLPQRFALVALLSVVVMVSCTAVACWLSGSARRGHRAAAGRLADLVRRRLGYHPGIDRGYTGLAASDGGSVDLRRHDFWPFPRGTRTAFTNSCGNRSAPPARRVPGRSTLARLALQMNPHFLSTPSAALLLSLSTNPPALRPSSTGWRISSAPPCARIESGPRPSSEEVQKL